MSSNSEIDDHFRRMISLILKVEEKSVQSEVDVIELTDGNYICHFSMKFNGQDLNERQKNAVLHAIKHFGLPGIRLFDLQTPAKA